MVFGFPPELAFTFTGIPTHLKIERFSAGLKSSFPLLKQGASTKRLKSRSLAG